MFIRDLKRNYNFINKGPLSRAQIKTFIISVYYVILKFIQQFEHKLSIKIKIQTQNKHKKQKTFKIYLKIKNLRREFI